MQTKLGRNDPCDCGSGKKYKKCCMTSSIPSKKGGAMKRDSNNLREFSLQFIHGLLLPYLEKCLSPHSSHYAMLESIIPDLPPAVNKDVMHDLFFLPLYLFNWRIQGDDCGQDWEFAEEDADKTVAELYLDTYEEWMEPEQKTFIQAMLKTYYSFYSVTAINANQTVELKDLLLGTAHSVQVEQTAIESLNRGEIIFSRLLTLNGQSIMLGTAPILFPIPFQPLVMDFRDDWLKENQKAAWTVEILREESQYALLRFFLKLLNVLYSSSAELTDDQGKPVGFL
jgi:hypothetical protein